MAAEADHGPGDPLVEGFDRLVEGELEDHPESFLDVVGPVEVRVGSHDPVELDDLLAGQGVGVAQQRVSAALDAGRIGAVGPGRSSLRGRPRGRLASVAHVTMRSGSAQMIAFEHFP